MKHGLIQTASPSIITGSKRQYAGAAPYPVTPTKEDTWIEYDLSDNFIEEWVYNGSIWLSKNIYGFSHIATRGNVTDSVANCPMYPLESGSNILLLNFLLSGVQTVNSNGLNFWSFNIQRLDTALVTSIATFNTLTPTPLTANNWFSLVYPINTLINISATNSKVLRVLESRTGGTASKIFSHIIQYKKVRL